MNLYESATIKIYDKMEQMVSTLYAKNGDNQYDFSTLHSGFYFLHLKDEKGYRANFRIIKL